MTIFGSVDAVVSAGTRSIADLLLSPRGLGPPLPNHPPLASSLRDVVGEKGFVTELEHPGDPREPASLFAVAASPGRPEGRSTLLFVHGKGGAGSEWRPDARRALKLGYNVLIPDLRGHGRSSGARVTFGLFETEDLNRLVAEAERLGFDPARLGIDGCSMGSLVALHFAAQAGRSGAGVRALWLQSPFSGLREMATHYVHTATGLPSWSVALPTTLALCEIERRTGLTLSALDPTRAARELRCPAVIVHGEEDRRVPLSFVRPLFAAFGGPVELWKVPRCGHCHHADEAQAIHGTAYRSRWREFFARYLPPES